MREHTNTTTLLKGFSYSQNAAPGNTFKDTLLNMRGGACTGRKGEVVKHSKESEQLRRDKESGENKPEDRPESRDTKGGITREEQLPD